jgi:hypothetical protein
MSHHMTRHSAAHGDRQGRYDGQVARIVEDLATHLCFQGDRGCF